MKKPIYILLLFLFVSSLAYAQVSQQTQLYRDDELGNVQYRREGIMDGNLVRTLFYNNGEVGQWPFDPSGEWPKGSGHGYLDGVAMLITTEVETPAGFVHPLETSYREWMDRDPVTGAIWGIEPVPYYANPTSTLPAISGRPTSWPEIWPKVLPNIDADWDGLWYGYFGRGVTNSDFETFFVMDDSQDGEFARSPYDYHPISTHPERLGLGLRIEVRGFQWSHVLAEDIIFWHYDIVNLSDNDYTKTYFGFYTDTGVGGSDDSADDYASYDIELDLAYAYDEDGVGTPGRFRTGYYGYAYLESPGNATNGLDDDLDGMIDERRDDGIDNDNDWAAYSDLNGNGEWDPEDNEPLNNDLGKDGVGPFDRQYIGPDEGEGDGQPTDGEPNFDRTDKDESDQIGLTSLSIYRLGDGGTGGGWPKDDEAMWMKMQGTNFDTSLQNANISMVFASGPFPLYSELRERFSMALVFGSGLEDIVFNKETVQQIYNANYNFSRPPLKPSLTAAPGDGQVFLFWDGLAEESRDPFLGYENNDPTQGFKKDFEGYMIYRSQEPEFNDIKEITDSKGEPKYWKPIAQFDLKNGIIGPDPVGINGASFWRGSDTGLRHSYIDDDVVNGMNYYYAVVSYDQGDPEFGTKGLTPSECTKIISEDFSGVLQFVDINCAVVTPNAYAAGYVPPTINGNFFEPTEGLGTGDIFPQVLDPESILFDAQYRVIFEAQDSIPGYTTDSYHIERTYQGETTTIVSHVGSDDIGRGKTSPPFDGLSIEVLNDTTAGKIDSLSGWLSGFSNLTMNVLPDFSSPARNTTWPADYEIHFFNDDVYTTPFQRLPAPFKVVNITRGDTVDAEYFDNDGSGSLTVNDDIVIIEYVGTQYRLTWRVEYHDANIPATAPRPAAGGDVYRFVTRKQFYDGDYFTFSTVSGGVDKELAKSSLDDIRVVPNPYVAASSWEDRNLNSTGRGDRRIDFINLPTDATIRIYSISGQLVKTLYKDSMPTSGAVSWNLVTDDNMEAAFGLYVYHVDAPGIGEYTGKFAIVK